MTHLRRCLFAVAFFSIIGGTARAESAVPLNFVDDFGVQASPSSGNGSARNRPALPETAGVAGERSRSAPYDALAPRSYQRDGAAPRHLQAPHEDRPCG